MRIKIGPYPNWYGPYQLAETILFWKDKDDDIVFKFGEWLANNRNGQDSWLTKFCKWINSKRTRNITIHIDNYDVWSMDHTLSMIIVPMLEKLKENKSGAPFVDDEDVPANLRSTAASPLTEEQKNCGYTDDLWQDRWEWILDEMIWTFQQHLNEDWEDQYYSGTIDFNCVNTNDNNYSILEYGPNHTHTVDHESIKIHRKRMDNGRQLFAKYYQNLWY